MKKIIFLLALIFILSGCVTYKIQKGATPPFDKGYVASYDGTIIPEYTVGKDNSLPTDPAVAKERFNRRRVEVEKYYKDMDSIERRLKEIFWDPPVTILHIFIGIFKLPFIVYYDYKYEHNPEYRAKVTKAEEEDYAKEKARIKELKDKLNNYIQKDLAQEANATLPEQNSAKEVEPAQEVKMPEAAPAEAVKIMPQETVPEIKPQEVKPHEANPPEESLPKADIPETNPQEPQINEQAPAEKQDGVKAVIIARPLKGFSPLKVDFSGTQSCSSNGKIVSYDWDFGDGDTSNKPKAVNTYWSTTYGTRYFTVTLTVKDIKGSTAATTQKIEVINK